ncbi:MAG TPA: DegV family protein [Bacillota bacterium]|nr:DegV family protein [Bacillota bacterium]
MALRVVTDSTADIPDRIARQLGITVIPLNLHFGEEILKDGEDIWSEEFFNRMAYETVQPRTSQPSPKEFTDLYCRSSQPGDTILSIHAATQLSSTFDMAQRVAFSMNSKRRVIPIDTGLVSMGLGWIVIEIARLAARGESIEMILERIQKLRSTISLYFSVETMEYLCRTGRYIHKEGPQFNQRPILSVHEGQITMVGYFKGTNIKMGQYMLEQIRRDMAGRPFRLALIHANLSEEVERIRVLMMESGDEIREMIVAPVGPIIGAHSGTGTFGVIAVPVLP